MATFQKQVTYASINKKLKRSGLILRGGFTQERQTILLIGPNEPFFWEYFRNSSEYKDSLPYLRRLLAEVCGRRVLVPRRSQSGL